MRTKIISAFPGTGKSVYHQKHKETTLDSDSSNFSWIIDENGNKVERGGTGLMAQIFQHEIDHLDGVLFIDHAHEIREMTAEEKENYKIELEKMREERMLDI